MVKIEGVMEEEKLKILKEIEDSLRDRFSEIEDIALFNQDKVLKAFNKYAITNQHFAGTTGYGYTDKGKEGLSEALPVRYGGMRYLRP